MSYQMHVQKVEGRYISEDDLVKLLEKKFPERNYWYEAVSFLRTPIVSHLLVCSESYTTVVLLLETDLLI